MLQNHSRRLLRRQHHNWDSLNHHQSRGPLEDLITTIKNIKSKCHGYFIKVNPLFTAIILGTILGTKNVVERNKCWVSPIELEYNSQTLAWNRDIRRKLFSCAATLRPHPRLITMLIIITKNRYKATLRLDSFSFSVSDQNRKKLSGNEEFSFLATFSLFGTKDHKTFLWYPTTIFLRIYMQNWTTNSIIMTRHTFRN